MIIEPGDMIILSPDIANTDAIDAAKPPTLTLTFRYDSWRVMGAKPETHRHRDCCDNCQIARMLLEFFAKEVRCDFVAHSVARDRPHQV